MTIAVVAAAYGGPEVLSVVDVDPPTPGPGQVALAVRAAGINPIDWKLYSGSYGTDPAGLPMRLGFEVAGTVTALGDGVTGWQVGDDVLARVQGGYAADVLADADALVAKPATLDFAQASGLRLAGATAVHTLVATGVGPGDTVLIHGAAGGVGHLAVQAAVARGARVIGTASERNHELIRQLGGEPVSYGPGLADRVRALAPDGVTAAVDTVGTEEALDVSEELVADRGRIATIANFQRGTADGVKVLGNGPGGDPGAEIRRAAGDELAKLASEGRLTVIVRASYPLAETADAHRAGMTEHGAGKIALTV
jgi:NADPH:quinone reductase-like Zn-dependent oxidoreductase